MASSKMPWSFFCWYLSFSYFVVRIILMLTIRDDLLHSMRLTAVLIGDILNKSAVKYIYYQFAALLGGRI